ncbi:uncharacterized protein LOC143294556 [Babylonia areolata]|uniref:uncharacterized protein LOC143294556 n=1 Tax=Babylonia areolata TaxID=304850 RepID=UPI003FD38ACE
MGAKNKKTVLFPASPSSNPLRLLPSLLLLFLHVYLHAHQASAEIFKDCGGFLEEPRGVVQSPGFPNPFPVPLACRWVIHAPPEKKIVLYFTQYFLKEAFMVTEYEKYVSELVYEGRKSLGQINFEDHIRTVVAYKPYLVLDFCLHHMTNIHLRVEEYLEDVYGFNITYEVVDREEPMRQDTCSVNDCSFLGHCIASADFSSYDCRCFPEFFGRECQYGPYCDPDRGMNMCLNQGRCRYFYGSMVNVCECPEGYFGPKCEHGEDVIDEECAKLGCSDHCQKNYEGLLHCSCQDGFKLDTDNTTCIEQELFRVSVTVPLVKRPADWDEELATTQAITVLQVTGLRTSKRFQFDGINSTNGQELQMLHFYVDRSDLDLVQEGVENLMRRNNPFDLTVVTDNLTVRLDPKMKLLSVENYVAEPALEGKSLILVCTARGSKALQFRWYKDQFLFNPALTSRSAWEVRLNDEFDDKQMSIYNVEGVTMFDKGTFSCEVEDFGEVENRSVTVDVMPLPQVEIKPLTANLLPGQALSFRCLSPDENMRTFSYQWLRDGEELATRERLNGEIVEDLLPSGSRLFIPRLQLSANYTCRVVNKAGPSEKSAFVFMISPNMSEMVCESDSYEGVKWNRTYGGYYDLQICPIDTADFKVVGLGEGYARRDCVCDAVSCAWGPPNYARCHSIHLIYLYEQLERCQLGYQQDGLSRIYDSLYQILRKAQNRTLAGDVDMFAINLHTLFEVALRFPAVAPDPAKSSFSLLTVARFMNMLLDEVKTTNEFEKRDLSVGARFIRVVEILAELTRENPALVPLFNLTLPRIGFAVRNLTVLALNSSGKEEEEEEEGVPVQMSYTGRRLMSLLVNVGAKKKDIPKADRQLTVLQVTYTPEVMAILRVTNDWYNMKDFLTPLGVSAAGWGEQGSLGRLLRAQGRQSGFPVFVENITKCVAWDRRDSRQLVGEWKTGVCDVTHRTANVTRCLCPVPGHYTVVVIATNLTAPAILPVQRDTALLVGCVVSLCGLVAAMLVYFVCWRHIAGDSSMIHANFLLSLVGLNLVCIVCLSHPGSQTVCMLGKVMLHLLQLSAISFLLVEAIHTYVCIQTTGFGGGHSRIKYACLKYFLIGWGIPGLATLAVTLLSEMFGYDDTCTSWCWWSAGQWQHYSFLVPMVVMVLVQVIIMSACIVCTRLWKDEHRFRDRTKYVYIAVRSFVLQALVVLLSVSGHLVETDRSLGNQGFFAFIDIFLSLTVLTTLLLLKPKVRMTVFSFLIPENKQGLAPGSFKAFVLPDRVEDSEQLEVKDIQEYCSERDRSKFTSQHKQKLRNLLGSSSSGSDASASGGAGSSLRGAGSSGGGGQENFFSRRSHSAGSRSNSSSDHGGGGGVGVAVGGSRPRTGGVRGAASSAAAEESADGRKNDPGGGGGGRGAPSSRKSRAKLAPRSSQTTSLMPPPADPLASHHHQTPPFHGGPHTGGRGGGGEGSSPSASPFPSPSHSSPSSPSSSPNDRRCSPSLRPPMLCQQAGLLPEHDWTRKRVPPPAPPPPLPPLTPPPPSQYTPLSPTPPSPRTHHHYPLKGGGGGGEPTVVVVVGGGEVRGEGGGGCGGCGAGVEGRRVGGGGGCERVVARRSSRGVGGEREREPSPNLQDSGYEGGESDNNPSTSSASSSLSYSRQGRPSPLLLSSSSSKSYSGGVGVGDGGGQGVGVVGGGGDLDSQLSSSDPETTSSAPPPLRNGSSPTASSSSSCSSSSSSSSSAPNPLLEEPSLTLMPAAAVAVDVVAAAMSSPLPPSSSSLGEPLSSSMLSSLSHPSCHSNNNNNNNANNANNHHNSSSCSSSLSSYPPGLPRGGGGGGRRRSSGDVIGANNNNNVISDVMASVNGGGGDVMVAGVDSEEEEGGSAAEQEALLLRCVEGCVGGGVGGGGRGVMEENDEGERQAFVTA